jgi:predicted signal transduction protein with EAL and GGDEF domain
VAAIELEVRPGKTIKLGASIGAAVYPHDGANYEALLADADHRMYRDKTHRRLGGPRHAGAAEPRSDAPAVGPQAFERETTVTVSTSIS